MPVVQYFNKFFTLEELTKERNRLARIHHPDRGGDTKTMQEINAQFEVAKKKLESGYNPGNYANPFQYSNSNSTIDDLLAEMMRQNFRNNPFQQWWDGQANYSPGWQPKEPPEQKARKERDAREAKEKEERKEEYLWAISQIRLANQQGLLRDCRTTVNMGHYLYVKGKIEPHRKWFEEHGFIWNGVSSQWEFVKRPKVNHNQ